MDPQETQPSTEAPSRTQAVWETLTAAQQATVLQTMVWICRQIAEQWILEVPDESAAE